MIKFEFNNESKDIYYINLSEITYINVYLNSDNNYSIYIEFSSDNCINLEVSEYDYNYFISKMNTFMEESHV